MRNDWRYISHVTWTWTRPINIVCDCDAEIPLQKKLYNKIVDRSFATFWFGQTVLLGISRIVQCVPIRARLVSRRLISKVSEESVSECAISRYDFAMEWASACYAFDKLEFFSCLFFFLLLHSFHSFSVNSQMGKYKNVQLYSRCKQSAHTNTQIFIHNFAIVHHGDFFDILFFGKWLFSLWLLSPIDKRQRRQRWQRPVRSVRRMTCDGICGNLISCDCEVVTMMRNGIR